MKYTSICILFISLSSCSLFYKTILGIKNPKIETYNSIEQYASTLSITKKELLFTKDSASCGEINVLFGGSPEIIIFNKSKKFIPYKQDGVSCNAPVDMFLKNICQVESFQAISKKEVSFNHFLSLIDDHYNSLSILNDSTLDYIIFADFAKSFPKVNKTHIIDWGKELNQHTENCKAILFYVNLDCLDTWGMSKKSLPKFKVSASKH